MTAAKRGARILILCGAAMFALLLVLLVAGTGRAPSRTASLIKDAEALRADISALKDNAKALELKAKALEADIINVNKVSDELGASYRDAGMEAGFSALTGPGVEVKLSDASRASMLAAGENWNINWFLVHDRDVLAVVNLLKSAGAEAVAVNGVRMTPSAAIHCGGPAIYVRDIPLTPPFLITAIGDPEKLGSAILGSGNEPPAEIYLELMAGGIVFEVSKSQGVHVPAADTAEAAINAAH